MTFTGILLAGGSSSRMGTDKGLVKFQGRRLAEYALDLLSRFCDEILISTAHPEYAAFGFRTIPDQLPGKGPLSGLAATLPHSSNEWNLVLGCDMPYANSALFEFLIEKTGVSLGVVPIHDNLIEPVAAIYCRTAGRLFGNELAMGHYSLYKILLNNDFTFPDTGFLLAEFPFLFKSLNEPDDLVIACPVPGGK